MHAIEAVAVPVIEQELVTRGWQRAEGDEPAFSMAGPDELRYNVGLSLARLDPGLRMLPALGVQHVETSRLVSQFKGLTPGRTSTFGRALMDVMRDGGYPSAEFGRWFMGSAADVAPTTARLLDDLDTYGMPFLQSFSNLNDILARLRQQRRNNITDYALAVASALAGDWDYSMHVLNDIATEAQGQQGRLAAMSWRFVDSFVDHFGIDRSDVPSPDSPS